MDVIITRIWHWDLWLKKEIENHVADHLLKLEQKNEKYKLEINEVFLDEQIM